MEHRSTINLVKQTSSKLEAQTIYKASTKCLQTAVNCLSIVSRGSTLVLPNVNQIITIGLIWVRFGFWLGFTVTETHVRARYNTHD